MFLVFFLVEQSSLSGLSDCHFFFNWAKILSGNREETFFLQFERWRSFFDGWMRKYLLMTEGFIFSDFYSFFSSLFVFWRRYCFLELCFQFIMIDFRLPCINLLINGEPKCSMIFPLCLEEIYFHLKILSILLSVLFYFFVILYLWVITKQ